MCKASKFFHEIRDSCEALNVAVARDLLDYSAPPISGENQRITRTNPQTLSNGGKSEQY